MKNKHLLLPFSVILAVLIILLTLQTVTYLHYKVQLSKKSNNQITELLVGCCIRDAQETKFKFKYELENHVPYSSNRTVLVYNRVVRYDNTQKNTQKKTYALFETP